MGNIGETLESGKPAFLITIDTEGDNLWANPKSPETKNAEFLPRFQQLCESYGLKPTYLTNYEMARSAVYKEFGLDVIARNAGEIGMHLHAWDMPPYTSLLEEDSRHHPYLIEYPDEVMREKIAIMTDLLEDTFGVKMVSHRSGRWAFDERYAGMLLDKGYQVDCSVTPYVSWKTNLGDPNGQGGTDYSAFPDTAYFLDHDDISKRGNSKLLEVPVTIMRSTSPTINRINDMVDGIPGVRKVIRRCMPSFFWLRPMPNNRDALLYVVRRAVSEKRDYVEFMMHSSELMLGGSPYFQDQKAIDMLFADLESLFALARDICVPATMAEYYMSTAAKYEVHI